MGSKRTMRRVASSLGVIGIALLTLWSALVCRYADIVPAGLGAPCAAVLAALGAASMWALWRARYFVPLGSVFALAVLAVVHGWTGITPSNDRTWRPEVAELARASIDGGRVTVHNIRNFDYRGETDFSPRYYDRTFDVADLTAVDLFAVYWMGPAIAHTMVSFSFRDGSQLAVSIETRKEVGEDYSTILGFFRHYELYYVVADERDVVRLRTTFREPPEDVYLYRVRAPIENSRRLFLTYMRRLNELAAKPAFYNTLADNCTTGVWLNTLSNVGHLPLSWKLLASGYVPQYLYESGRLDDSLPFAELQSRSLINARARAAAADGDFSRALRRGLPGFDTVSVP